MGIQIDQVSITVKGNVVKKFDGKTTLLRLAKTQLQELRESIDSALPLLEAHPIVFEDTTGETSELKGVVSGVSAPSPA